MDGRYFSVRQIAFLSVMGAFSCILDSFHIPLHTPGNHSIFWVIPIIFGVGMVKKLGSATCVGFIGGILIAFTGLEPIGPFVVLEYLAMGFMIDILAAVFRGHIGNIVVGFVIGAAGSLSKLAVHYPVVLLLGMTRGRLILVGFGVAMISYFVFGGLGGAITSIILRGFEHLPPILTNLSGKPVKQMKK